MKEGSAQGESEQMEPDELRLLDGTLDHGPNLGYVWENRSNVMNRQPAPKTCRRRPASTTPRSKKLTPAAGDVRSETRSKGPLYLQRRSPTMLSGVAVVGADWSGFARKPAMRPRPRGGADDRQGVRSGGA